MPPLTKPETFELFAQLVQTLVASLQTLDIGNHHMRLRRLDRTLHRWNGRQYPYVLPGSISR